MRKTIKTNKIKTSDRVTRSAMDKAMKSLLHGAIELITNSDDSYERQNKSTRAYCGDVRIEYKKGNQANPTIFTIKDRAEGMTREKLYEVLSNHGEEIKSMGASRGYFGRGLIDCSAMGDVYIHTVHSSDPNKCSKTKISHRELMFDRIETIKFNSEIKKLTGIKKHGTCISINIPIKSAKEFSPRADSLKDQIRLHYSLRNILFHKKSDFMGTVDLKFNEEKVSYVPPGGKKIIDNHRYKVTTRNGKDIFAYFDLYKSDSELNTTTDKNLDHYGILIQGKKAIHDKNFLTSKYKNNSNAKYYFGKITCEYIDDLLKEFYDRDMNKKPFETDNPFCFVSDERKGIAQDHPFFKELCAIPSELLDKEIDKDVKKGSSNLTTKGIEERNNQVTKIFDKLVKEISDANQDGHDDKKPWYCLGSFKVELGDQGHLNLYVKESELSLGDEVDVVISPTDKKYISIKSNKLKLKNMEGKNGYKKGTLLFDTIAESKNITISFYYKNNYKTGTKVNVFVNKSRAFVDNIEFERETYTVKENKNRKIKVYAKYPEVIKKDNQTGKVFTQDHNVIKAPSICKFKVIKGTNYACAEFPIKGISLNDTTLLTTKVDTSGAETIVEVAKYEDNNQSGPKHEIKIVDINLGTDTRAEWDPQNPHILQITIRHKLVAQYLGEKQIINGQEKWSNEESEKWSMFYADICSEKFAQKYVTYTALNKPDEYAELKDVDDINTIIQFSQSYYNLIKNKLIKDFYK